MLIIGRGRGADIRLRDASVSRLHAELVTADDGLLQIADRSSANGTWIAADGRWERIAQRVVAPGDRLRFGSREVVVSELLRRAPVHGNVDSASERAAAVVGSGARDAEGLPAGPVRRDPETGEVIAD